VLIVGNGFEVFLLSIIDVLEVLDHINVRFAQNVLIGSQHVLIMSLYVVTTNGKISDFQDICKFVEAQGGVIVSTWVSSLNGIFIII
jgi:hypothetical protein